MSYLDELYRARADKAGITYVDIWDGFVDETMAATRCRGRISRDKFAGCAPLTASISPRRAR